MADSAPDLRGARWRKSTRSGGAQQCVEVAAVRPWRAVRDSKNPTGPTLVFNDSTFAAFLDVVDYRN